MTSPGSDGLRRRRWTAQERQDLLRRYHESQLSQKGFALREGIVLSSLTRWLKQEREAGTPALRFQEVILPTASSPWALELVSPQGWTVRMQRAADVSSLAAVLGALPC